MSRFTKGLNTTVVHTSRALTALIAGGAVWLVAHAVVGSIPVLPLLAGGAACWWTWRYLRRP